MKSAFSDIRQLICGSKGVTAPCHLCFDRQSWHSKHTCKQPGEHRTRSRTQSQHESLGIFSQIGPLKGKGASINQLVSRLQTPTAPYRHTQADTLTD